MKTSQKRITQGDYIRERVKFATYIRECDKILRSDEYIIVHLDGIKFTGKYYKRFSKEDKKKVVEALANVAKRLCEEYLSAKIAYVYGDEISIILDGAEVQTNYHNRIQKLCSCIASQTSIYFQQELSKINKGTFDELIQNSIFACKTYNLPTTLIDPYMKWRLNGCKKMIFDRYEEFDNMEDWEKYGFLLTKQSEWNKRSIDFSSKKFQIQNKFFELSE